MSFHTQAIADQKITFYYETFDDWYHNWHPLNFQNPNKTKKYSVANPDEYKKMHTDIIQSEKLKSNFFMKLSYITLITGIAATAIALTNQPNWHTSSGLILIAAGGLYLSSMLCRVKAKQIHDMGCDRFILNEAHRQIFTIFAKTIN